MNDTFWLDRVFFQAAAMRALTSWGGRGTTSSAASGGSVTEVAEVDLLRPLVHPWLYWNVCVSDDEMHSKRRRTGRTDIFDTSDIDDQHLGAFIEPATLGSTASGVLL